MSVWSRSLLENCAISGTTGSNFGMVAHTPKPLGWDECATQREHTSFYQWGF